MNKIPTHHSFLRTPPNDVNHGQPDRKDRAALLLLLFTTFFHRLLRSHFLKITINRNPLYLRVSNCFHSLLCFFFLSSRLTLLMAKINKLKCKADSHSRRSKPYPLPSFASKSAKDHPYKKKQEKTSEKKDWEGVSCAVCLEFPHNAVLLLCSSYNKGCRPYMCATSRRFSNCLAQFKKAYTKVIAKEEMQQLNRSSGNSSVHVDAGEGNEKTEAVELLCPLCRGQVKGWTVVEPARKHFNAKKRTCMQDKCSFTGTYKQLKKHVKAKHPLARPRAVDPVLEEKWKKLECERERSDVISTIMSSTPGAVVLGDYVIEPGRHAMFDDFDYESDDSLGGGFYPLEPFNRRRSLRGFLMPRRRFRRFTGATSFRSRYD